MFVRIWIIGWAVFATSFSQVFKIETETLSRQIFHEQTFKNATDPTWSSSRLSQWSNWSEWSACTRPCEGGIMIQTRTCLISPENVNRWDSSSIQLNNKKTHPSKSQCTGPSKRTKICNDDACPPDVKDFRTIQCEYYNQNTFAGMYYTWEAYYEERNQCALNCRPVGYKFYATLKRTVADGTSCHHHTGERGVCLDGKCDYQSFKSNLGSTSRDSSLNIHGFEPIVLSSEDEDMIIEGNESYESPSCFSTNQSTLGEKRKRIYEVDVDPPNKRACKMVKSESADTSNFDDILMIDDMEDLDSDNSLSSNESYIGCDGVIGGQKLDICGVCGGNNSTCRLISGLFTRPNLVFGYNYITDIPQHACNITISEIKKSNNLFALRDKNGTYILNGNWSPNQPGTYNAVGTQFTYTKGKSNLGEFISSPGPTSQPLEFLLLYRQPNPGIKYEYQVAMPVPYRDPAIQSTSQSFPQGQNYQGDALELQKYEDSGKGKKSTFNSANSFSEDSVEQQGVINDEEIKPKLKSNKRKKFLWKITAYTPCSKTCGGGIQSPIYSCVKEFNQQHVVAEKRCAGLDKPEKESIRCSPKPCPAMWVVGEWGQCSVTCDEGVESREVLCKQEISSALSITVSEEACLTSLSPNLLRTRPCFRKPCPDGSASAVKPYWKTGTWSTCSTRCGIGIKTRTVQCMAESEDECPRVDRPSHEIICDMGPCSAQGTHEWLTTDWTPQCSETCGLGTQSRRVMCSAAPEQEQLCEKTTKPETIRNCSSTNECTGRWFSSPWSRCSVDCGWGKQARTAVCVAYNMDSRIHSITTNSHCVEKEKPSSEQACFERPCNHQWFAASWSACTRSCDSGVQRREVRCVNEDLKPSIDCKEEEKPATRRSCNNQRCAIYSDAKEIDSNIQDTQTEAAGQNGANNNARNITGNPDCKDQLNNCHLVTQARLCNYKYYKTFCCASCFSLYHSTTNSTNTLNST